MLAGLVEPSSAISGGSNCIITVIVVAGLSYSKIAFVSECHCVWPIDSKMSKFASTSGAPL